MQYPKILFSEEEFTLFFPAVGDAATEFFQRQTDRLAVLPYRLHNVRRKVRQLKRPATKERSMFNAWAICRMVVALPEMICSIP